MDWKTEQEWIIMRYFSEHYSGWPKGKLLKGESPDFRLRISTKRFIGIELTQIHRTDPGHNGDSVLYLDSATGQILRSLQLKEEKITRYRSDHPHKLWLIIFVDYAEPQAIGTAMEELSQNRLPSSFDKVFLFDLDLHQTFELK